MSCKNNHLESSVLFLKKNKKSWRVERLLCSVPKWGRHHSWVLKWTTCGRSTRRHHLTRTRHVWSKQPSWCFFHPFAFSLPFLEFHVFFLFLGSFRLFCVSICSFLVSFWLLVSQNILLFVLLLLVHNFLSKLKSKQAGLRALQARFTITSLVHIFCGLAWPWIFLYRFSLLILSKLVLGSISGIIMSFQKAILTCHSSGFTRSPRRS